MKRIRIGDVEVDTAHLPHPGIVMRESKDSEAMTSPWPERNRQFVAAWLPGWALAGADLRTAFG